MDEKNVTSPAVKGLIISLVLIVFSVFVLVLEQDTNPKLQFVAVAIMLAGIIWACISFGNQMNANVTFGKVFSHGFKASALIAGVMAFWVVLTLTILFPESLERGMEMQREAMLKKGNVSEDQVDQYMKMGRKMAVPMGALFTVIFYLFVGAIAALLGAAFAKKNPRTIQD